MACRPRQTPRTSSRNCGSPTELRGTKRQCVSGERIEEIDKNNTKQDSKSGTNIKQISTEVPEYLCKSALDNHKTDVQ